MAHQLDGKPVAILVAKGFEQVEMTEPRHALQAEGANVELVSPEGPRVRAWNHIEWGDEHDVDAPLHEANPDRYDALVLPGGVMNPDKLRMNPAAVTFVRAFFQAGKPVAVICHAAWTLIEAEVVRGRRMTAYPSLETDLKNAGALWENREVVVDNGLVTSRKPADLPAFCREMIEEFARGARPAQALGAGVSESAFAAAR